MSFNLTIDIERRHRARGILVMIGHFVDGSLSVELALHLQLMDADPLGLGSVPNATLTTRAHDRTFTLSRMLTAFRVALM